MNPYDILGVKENATESECKKAYIRLIKIHHPDKGGDPQNFQNIQNAWNNIQKYNNQETKTHDAIKKMFSTFEKLYKRNTDSKIPTYKNINITLEVSYDRSGSYGNYYPA